MTNLFSKILFILLFHHDNNWPERERLYANVCKYRPCGNAGNTLEITHYWNIMTHVIQAEWTIHQMSRPNPLFCLTVVSNSDWRIWVRPEQTSVFPAFHTRTICFGPFLKVSISYSFSHFCRTPSLLRKVWTKSEWEWKGEQAERENSLLWQLILQWKELEI